MVHLQYYNSVIKNNHINKILNNYRIKYSQIKNEIELKLSQMMKLFLKDILSFLENLEEVAEQKQKINEYNTISKELEITKAKMKEKISLEYKLKNESEILQPENCLLKLKINSLNYKINNLINLNNSNSQSPSPNRKNNNSMSKRKINSKLKINFMSPRSEQVRNVITHASELNNSYSKSNSNLFSSQITENNRSDKTRENNNKLTLKLNYDRMTKSKKLSKSKKKKVKMNIKKFVYNRETLVSTKNKNDNYKKKFNFKLEDDGSTKSRPIINQNINKNKKVNLSVEKMNGNNVNKYSPINTINQSSELPTINNINIDYETLGNDINNVIDNELKELEQDEAKIELLLEQLINYNKKNTK